VVVCARESYGDGQAAFGTCVGGEDGVVRRGDRADDGEPEPVSVAGEPLERLEQSLYLILGYDGSAVRDRDADPGP
jgi:hypothetical protein